MISIVDAINLVFRDFQKWQGEISGICSLPDSWIFSGTYQGKPLIGVQPIRVFKENGLIREFILPNDENFFLLKQATSINAEEAYEIAINYCAIKYKAIIKATLPLLEIKDSIYYVTFYINVNNITYKIYANITNGLINKQERSSISIKNERKLEHSSDVLELFEHVNYNNGNNTEINTYAYKKYCIVRDTFLNMEVRKSNWVEKVEYVVTD